MYTPNLNVLSLFNKHICAHSAQAIVSCEIDCSVSAPYALYTCININCIATVMLPTTTINSALISYASYPYEIYLGNFCQITLAIYA